MHSTFIWQLNLPGSFVSKLPYKGKVFFEGPRTYRGVFEGGTVPKGKAGAGREALFGVQTSQGALGSHSTAAITAGRREMPYQASARDLLKSCICVSLTITQVLSPCLGGEGAVPASVLEVWNSQVRWLQLSALGMDGTGAQEGPAHPPAHWWLWESHLPAPVPTVQGKVLYKSQHAPWEQNPELLYLLRPNTPEREGKKMD